MHKNFVEQMPVIVINLVLGGLFVPTFALIVSLMVLIGRILYTRQYVGEGSDKRLMGVGIMVVPLYALTLWTYFTVGHYMLFKAHMQALAEAQE